ncbi:hypothetical protein HMSSN139_53500 [Paenibacillus sp. HMSSN-139]|nr:hypothetical protein HMSSN139_53500 [Paenibacillus sp. HMSSN-139]
MNSMPHELQDSERHFRLLGREWETEVFSIYLKHYANMERIINIYGSAGVGKSSLAEEFQNKPPSKELT